MTPAPPDPERTYPLAACQWKLAVLWLVAAALLSILLLVQVAGGVYGDQGEKALAWLLPNLVPTLAMIGGAVAYQVTHSGTELRVTQLAFRGTWAFSLIYLLVILTSILLVPVARRGIGENPLEWLALPGAILTGLSAIVSGALGAFFVSSSADPAGAEARRAAARGEPEPTSRP